MTKMQIAACFIALFGMTVSLKCDSCSEFSLSGDGSDLFKKMMESTGQVVSCKNPKKQTCNADLGEDECNGVDIKVGLKGSGVNVEMGMKVKTCMNSGAKCDDLEKALLDSYSNMQGVKMNLKSCKMMSSAQNIFSGMFIITAAIIVQLF